MLLMSGGAVQAIQLFAALSILILLHEFGHFFFARLFKTRVEKFYLFFDFLFPFPGLLNFSLFKKKKGDTEYGLGWFPLGGYVKIAGMVDESMDTEAMKQPPQPWEYRSKKAWQRLFIMLGGIIMNVLVAVGIYALIFGVWGEEYLPVKNAKYGIAVDSVGESIGLRNGDMIVGINGKKIDRFNMIMPEIIYSEAKVINIQRNGVGVDIAIPKGTINKIIKAQRNSFIQPRTPIVVYDVATKSEASNMGLKAGDSIVAVNNMPVVFYDEFEKIKRASAGKAISLTVVRNAQTVILNGKVPDTKLLGFSPKSYADFFTMDKITYNPITAIGKGFTNTVDEIANYGRQLKLIFTSSEVKASESVGGIGSFAKMFPSVFDWQLFLKLLAFVSIILAVMNLLPIPGLDGGYVVFLLYEMITGRQVNEKVMEVATTIGLVLLLALMVYANGLDVYRWIAN